MFRPVINVATESPGDFMSLITVIPLSPHKYCPLLVIKSEAHELVSLIKLSDLSRGVIFHSLSAPVCPVVLGGGGAVISVILLFVPATTLPLYASSDNMRLWVNSSLVVIMVPIFFLYLLHRYPCLYLPTFVHIHLVTVPCCRYLLNQEGYLNI